jgi:hypothetical protein
MDVKKINYKLALSMAGVVVAAIAFLSVKEIIHVHYQSTDKQKLNQGVFWNHARAGK